MLLCELAHVVCDQGVAYVFVCRYLKCELPIFCRNVDSFPFWQISSALSACSHALLGKVMPNFSGDVDRDI